MAESLSGSAVLVESLQCPEFSPGGRQIVLQMAPTAAALVAEQAPKTAKVGLA